MNIEIGHRAFVEIEKAWREFTSDQTWEGVRTLKFALEKAMIGKEPDPQADGGIVKLTKILLEVMDRGKNHYQEVVAVAQAIETKFKQIQDEQFQQRDKILEYGDEIGAVRKLFRNHEERINAMQETRRLDKKERKALERKVEELENKVSQVLPDLTLAKPQPAEQHFLRQHKPVARCKDMKGVEHDLIPGRSVIEEADRDGVGIFHHMGKFERLYAYWTDLELRRVTYTLKNPSFARRQDTTWLFDLDFPSSCGDKGTIAKAQDKQIRPGSVCRDYDGETVVCLNKRNPELPVCVQISGDRRGDSFSVHHTQLTKLFDLPIPKGGTQ